jgi:hypothetical protein
MNTALKTGERIRYGRRYAGHLNVYSGTVVAFPSTDPDDGPSCALVACDDGGTHHVPVDTLLPVEEEQSLPPRIAALVAQVTVGRPGHPGSVVGTPAVLAELCAFLGFKNDCRRGSVHLTHAKLRRLGL